jgi:hypothetical protein
MITTTTKIRNDVIVVTSIYHEDYPYSKIHDLACGHPHMMPMPRRKIDILVWSMFCYDLPKLLGNAVVVVVVVVQAGVVKLEVVGVNWLLERWWTMRLMS